jgi:MFS transporter, PPP family, 3-phenylpropionic acid transporter
MEKLPTLKDDETMSTEHPRADLRRVAGITFLTFAARGFTLPFMNLYLVSLGFTGTQIGQLITISALVQLVLPPALHALADRTRQHRRLYYAFLMGNAAASFGLVAGAGNPLLLGGFYFLRDSSDSPSASLLSQLTITWLDQRKQAIYGRLRSWGSFGWAVTTLISGRIVTIGGYPLLFVLTGMINIALLPLVKVLPERTVERHEQQRGASRSVAFYILMVSLFLFAFGNNAIGAFSFIFFKQNLGASNDLIGIVSSVAALSEIPSMFFIDWLLRRASIRTTLALGMLGQALLWIGYTLLVGPTFLIPLMIFRGTFFTFFNVSATLLVSRISPPANAATNQAIAQVTVPSMAVLVAGWINGWMFDNLGPHILFLVAALMASFAVILLLFARNEIASQEGRMQALRQDKEVVETIPLADAD